MTRDTNRRVSPAAVVRSRPARSLLAMICACGLAVVQAAPDAASEGSAQQALRQAKDRMEVLQILQEKVEVARIEAARLQWTSDGADLTWRKALQAGTDAGDCVAQLGAALKASDRAVSALAEALTRSYEAVHTLARAPSQRVAEEAGEIDAAFDRRAAAEQALREQENRLVVVQAQCNELIVAADRFRDSARALPSRLQHLRNAMDEAFAAYRAAATAEWVPPGVEPPSLPKGAQLRELERTVSARASDPALATSQVFAGETDFAQIARELARMQDAATFLDLTNAATRRCLGRKCGALASERRELAERIIDARIRLDGAHISLAAAAVTLDGLLLPVKAAAQARAKWLEGLSATLSSALSEAAQAAAAARSSIEALAGAADAAHAQRPNVVLLDAILGIVLSQLLMERADLSLDRAVTAHAYETFETWDAEPRGFGAYTYVLLRSGEDLNSPAVRTKYQRLLATLHRLPVARLVAGAQREQVNLFCIPARPAENHKGGEPEVTYAFDLGHQLKLRAQGGLLTRPGMLKRLTGSPGPFLITFPTRISETRSNSPLLFADLAPYGDDAIADLAVSYMTGLLEDFPRQQTLWKPPVPQRVALVLIHLAADTGEIIAHAMPVARVSGKSP